MINMVKKYFFASIYYYICLLTKSLMIGIRVNKIYFLIIALFFITFNSYAQYSSEEELKEAAAEFFEQENFIEALPLYSQLLSLYPKDPNYNYRYGASSLYGSTKKDEAISYLKFAVSKASVEPLAYYYLAKAYHHNYDFSSAIVYYNKFKEKEDAKVYEKYQTDRQIEMCQNGQKLLKGMVNIGVLSKKEIKSTDFFRSYNLKGIGGKIIVKPDDFKTKIDKKKKEASIIHVDPNKKEVIFSSYGTKNNNGKDIYRVTKLPDGEWSEPINLGNTINSPYDEDYPFLHPDGKTLYFSSKGYNSMGGYDIFRSTLNTSTGQWSTPENIDFPINTPDDDILYITDIDNKLAYFASSRSSKQGELTVYRVKVDPVPSQHTVIKGMFLAETNPNLKSATITITDAENDQKYGVYTTDNKSGEYLLQFPENGGKFKLLVETSGDSPIHSAIIEVPKVEGAKSLQQELILVGEGESEKLVVKNLFDEVDEFDISDPLIVANLLKERAQLNVNTTEEEALNNSLQNDIDDALSNKSEYADLSDEQMITITNEKTTRLIEKAKESRDQSNKSYQLADQKSKEAKKNYETSPENKIEAANSANAAFAALNIAQTTENEAVERESDLEKIDELKNSIVEQLEKGNRKEAEASFAKLNEISESSYQTESALEKEKELANETLRTKQEDFNKRRENVKELNIRETELAGEIEQLETSLGTTKKRSLREDLESQISAKEIDLEDIRFDLEKEKKKETQSKKELLKAKSEAQSVESIVADINGSTNVSNEELQVSSKLRLDNDISYFEDEGLLGLYPSELNEIDLESNNEELPPFVLADHKDEYNIIDEEGEIIDYNTQHSSSLIEADGIEDEQEKAMLIANVNKEWVESIDEEIEIRENQLRAESNNTEKLKLEDKLTELKKLKSQKEQEGKEQLVIAQLANEDITTANENEVAENIFDSEGNVVDYNNTYQAELDALGEEQTEEVNRKKSEIHKKWSNAIQQELLLKKIALSEADEADQPALESEITVLENKLVDNQKSETLYANQSVLTENNDLVLNDNNPEEIVVDEVTTQEENIESVGNEELANASENQIDLTQFDTSVVDIDGTVKPYDSALKNKIIAANKIENEVDKYAEKAAITEKWITSIDEEINYRNEVLKFSEEGEKEEINVTIEKLNADKIAQQESLAEYQKVIELEKTKEEEANLTVNNLNAAEDEFSNLKYNNKYNYKSPQLANDISNTSKLKEEAAKLMGEAEIKTNSLVDLATNEEKQMVLDDVDKLISQSENKQIQIAENYQKANAIEYSNNQRVLSKLKAINEDDFSEEAVLMDLFSDESETYFNQAQEARTEAENAENFTTKEVALQKAYELEMKAIEKQNKAINLSPRTGVEELYAQAEIENRLSNQQIVEDIGNEQSPTITEELGSNEETSIIAVGVDPVIDNSSTENETEDEVVDVVGTLTDETISETNSNDLLVVDEVSNLDNSQPIELNKVYEPMTISLPSDVELTSAKRLEKEAEVLNVQAQRLRDSAEVVRKKKQKEALILQADELTAQADQKTLEAQVFYEKIAEMKPQEEALVNDLSELREGLRNEKLLPEDNQTVSELDGTEISSIKNAEDYKSYAAFKKESRRLVKAAEVQYIAADELQKEVESDKELRAELLTTLETTSQEEERIELSDQITEIDNAIEEKEIRINTLRKEGTAQEKEALVAANRAEFLISVADDETANNYKAIEKVEVYKGDIVVDDLTSLETVEENNEDETLSEEILVEEPSVEDIGIDLDEVPEVLNESIFVMTPSDQSAYNESKKIPNVKLPEGLVFKVQIGAFRNQIPQDHFRGFAPIMAEDAGNGITRYTAGFFKGFNMANEAKNSIREIGYSDAFVVAFFNGKRIDINKARAMLDGNDTENGTINNASTGQLTNNQVNTTSNQIDNSQEELTADEVNSTNTSSVNNGQDNAIDNQAENSQDTPIVNNEESVNTSAVDNNQAANNNSLTTNNIETEEVVDGVSTDVRNIEGVFYTIQVGVFSRPVSAGDLNNISSLNSERLTSGLIRYTAGIYKNLADANDAKGAAVNLGIADAFIIAYQNSNRISVTKANELLGGIESQSQETSITNEVEVDTNEAPVITNENDQTVEENENFIIVFKVKLGEYEEEVPVNDAAIFLQLTSRGVRSYSEDNKTIYTIGAYADYEEALDMQTEMKKIGVENPAILAFKDGVKIDLQEALELLKK